MLSTQATWVFVYNTRNVTADEAQHLTWNDLLAEKWKGRVAWDAQALGFKELPFAPGWPMDRFKAFTNNLGANGVKLIAGGTNGVVQAVTQGEGDVGMAEAGTIVDQMSQGAPLAIAWPDVIPFNSLGTCMPKITLDNRALAQVFFAWRDIEGEWLRAKMGAGGARPYYAPESNKFALAKMARDAGVTSERLAQPRTVADFDQVEQNRQTAIAALKAGLQSGVKLPYTW